MAMIRKLGLVVRLTLRSRLTDANLYSGRSISTSSSCKEDVKYPKFEGRGENSEHFPCLSRLQEEVSSVQVKGVYGETLSGYKVFEYNKPFKFKHGGVIPSLELAYETWGSLNNDKNNTILLHTGLSGSSHACSHQDNPSAGWWEKFIGHGRALDTDKYYVICCNILGGCFGSTGPSSINPETGKEYCMTFPVVSVEDMLAAQSLLLDHLEIPMLHASVGCSLGGMQSLMMAALYPYRVGRVVSVSACAQSHPSSIALRYIQRRILMSDPHWNKGHYYGSIFPRTGMQHARELATIGYRSGPEWAARFGIKRANSATPPDFCPDFLIETYLERQGEKFCTSYDPNSLLYISKAMDMFDMGDGHPSLLDGMGSVKCPVLILGVTSDILFPVQQQRELESLLKQSGNDTVTYYELSSIFGHDTFLLDVNNTGVAIKGYLESDVASY